MWVAEHLKGAGEGGRGGGGRVLIGGWEDIRYTTADSSRAGDDHLLVEIELR